MDDETTPSTGHTLMEALESLAQGISKIKRETRLNESTIMDLFRIQLMWAEQSAREAARQAMVEEGEAANDE